MNTMMSSLPSCELYDFAWNDRNDNLQELHTQQHEYASWTRFLKTLDHSLRSALCEQVGNIRPRDDHDDANQRKERDEPAEFEDVACLHRMAGDSSLFVRFLAYRFSFCLLFRAQSNRPRAMLCQTLP